MPELPEVETTRRGIAPLVEGARVRRLTVTEPRLRRPVSPALARALAGQRIVGLRRRGKYLLFDTASGSAIVHLGMSGSLRLVGRGEPRRPHDHIELELDNGHRLRYHDPRRFGLWLWTRRDPLRHPLLRDLGPEPFDPRFAGPYLHQRARGRRAAIKPFLMDARTVVGVGNIYASEALYRAGIDPRRRAGRVSLHRYQGLAEAVRATLAAALEQGGTTLRDYVGGDGAPGYFRLRLAVYERAGQPCPRCGEPIRARRLAQRSTYYCPRCQS